MILGWIAKLASSPVFVNVIAPWIARGLTAFFEHQAARLETKGAVTQAKAAKTAEELREASKRLSDASRR